MAALASTLTARRNPAATEHEVHEIIRERWSTRAFADDPVPQPALKSLFEAARWAPSSMNEQPWAFIVADRHADPEGFDRVLSTLVPANAVWARRAPVLAVAVARLTYARNGAPNAHALYDTGQAVTQLVLQATALGLSVHQMGGFDTAAAREALGIPEGHQPVVVLAIGYPGDASELPEMLRARESAPRTRRPLAEQVFSGEWGAAWNRDTR